MRRRLDRRKLLRGTVAGALSMGLLAPAGAVLAANRATAKVLQAMEGWITSCLRGTEKGDC